MNTQGNRPLSQLADLKPAEALKELRELTARAPQSFQLWGHQKVVQYKDAVSRARKLINEKSNRKDFLHAAIKLLRSFE